MEFELIQRVFTFVIFYSPVLRTNGHVMFCRWFLVTFTSLLSEIRDSPTAICYLVMRFLGNEIVQTENHF